MRPVIGAGRRGCNHASSSHVEKVKPVVDKYSALIGEPWVKDMNAELAKMRGK